MELAVLGWSIYHGDDNDGYDDYEIEHNTSTEEFHNMIDSEGWEKEEEVVVAR